MASKFLDRYVVETVETYVCTTSYVLSSTLTCNQSDEAEMPMSTHMMQMAIRDA